MKPSFKRSAGFMKNSVSGRADLKPAPGASVRLATGNRMKTICLFTLFASAAIGKFLVKNILQTIGVCFELLTEIFNRVFHGFKVSNSILDVKGYSPKLLLFLALLFPLASNAQLVTGALTITNAPVNTSTLTVNGKIFTWTNGTPIGSQAIQITNTLAGDGTNLLNVAGLILPFNNASISQTNGTNFTLLGNNMAVSVGGTWASLVLTTNGNGAATNVTVPMSTLVASARTNIASQLIADLNLNNTNSIDQTKPIALQLVGTNNNQTIGGVKNFTGTLNAKVGVLTNGIYTNAAIYNGSNFGQSFRSPGGGTGSEQFGLSANASTNDDVSIGDESFTQGTGAIGLGSGTTTSSNNAIAIGFNATANGASSLALGDNSITQAQSSSAIGSQAESDFIFSTAIGASSFATEVHQIMMGTSGEHVTFPGNVFHQGSDNNIVVTGTNTINAVLVGTRFVNSALANGQNQDVVLGTNMNSQLSGLTAAFTTAGFVGGIDGRFCFVENPTAFQWTINNQSGFESTPANRIITGTGADIILSSNSWALFEYDGTVSRWKPLFASGSPSSGGSGTFSGTFTGNGGGLTNISASSVTNYRAGFQAIGNLATSQAVTFSTPLASAVGTNYSVSISSDSTLASAVGFSATSKTTNGFTINLSAGIAGGIGVDYIATPYQ